MEYRLADLFDPEPDEHGSVVIAETKVAVENREVYVWAALDRHTNEMIHVEVSPIRSAMDALQFLRTVFDRCRGRIVIRVDRGPWYNWSLDELDLDCEARRETLRIGRLLSPDSARSRSEPQPSSTDSRIAVRTIRLIGRPKPSLSFIMGGANADTPRI